MGTAWVLEADTGPIRMRGNEKKYMETGRFALSSVLQAGAFPPGHMFPRLAECCRSFTMMLRTDRSQVSSDTFEDLFEIDAACAS